MVTIKKAGKVKASGWSLVTGTGREGGKEGDRKKQGGTGKEGMEGREGGRDTQRNRVAQAGKEVWMWRGNKSG